MKRDFFAYFTLPFSISIKIGDMTEFVFFLCQTDGTIHIIVYREQHGKINQRVLHIK